MKISEQIAKRIRELYVGGNWTDSCIKEHLSDVSWQEATTKLGSLNTIAALTFHISYFVSTVLKVLQGGPLDAKDVYSFDVPPIHSQKDWELLVKQTLEEAETFAGLVEKLPEEQLWKTFEHEKYGTYYTNLNGIIEHSHYHLGQLVLLKKLLRQDLAR